MLILRSCTYWNIWLIQLNQIGTNSQYLVTSSPANISIKPITLDNWKQAIQLKVHDKQKEYVANNLYSIAESSFYEGAKNFGLYADDEMIGFALIYHPKDDEENAHIVRFMIDKEKQGKGYGSLGLKVILNDLEHVQKKSNVTLTVIPDNETARSFYESIGFENTGEVVDGEIKYRLNLG